MAPGARNFANLLLDARLLIDSLDVLLFRRFAVNTALTELVLALVVVSLNVIELRLEKLLSL